MTGKRKARKPTLFRFSKGFVMNFVGGAWPYVWVGVGPKGEEVHLLTLEPKEARRIGVALTRFADWADPKSKGGKG